MIDKPTDIVMIFVVAGLVLFTVGLGIDSINQKQSAGINDTFYRNIQERINDENGLAGTANNLTDGLANSGDSSEEQTQQNFIVRGFNSILKLGQVTATVSETFDEGAREVGLDPTYITLIVSGLLAIFAIVIFSWVRFG